MYILGFYLAVTTLSFRALATHIAQEPLSAPKEPPAHPAFCAIPNDCAKIDLNKAIPEHIPDLGSYMEKADPICRINAALAIMCLADIVTEGTCQIALAWGGDASRFKGHEVSRATIVEKAVPLLTSNDPSATCTGGEAAVQEDSGYWFILVKNSRYDLF